MITRASILVAGLLVASAAVAQRPPPPGQDPVPRGRAPRETMSALDRSRDFDRELNARMDPNSGKPLVKSAEVAACLAAGAKAAAAGLIGGPMTSDAKYQALTQALTGKYKICAPNVGVPLFFISGALAEELVRRAHPALADRIAPSEVAAAKAFSASMSGRLTMDSLGRCLAANSPGLTYRMLANAADSGGETAALTGLYAQTPECGQSAPPPGISIAEQRSSIATGLYQWLHRS